MKQIGIGEIHNRLLNIAKVFDNICRKHGISYYMLGGTMLGAIRHKGFIPWDDDMDFGVLRKDYERLKLILRTELPEQYKCCDYNNDKVIQYPFIKISDIETCIQDTRVNLPLEDQIGINIDVFPLDNCELNSLRLKLIRCLCRMTTMIYVESTTQSKKIHIIKKILRFLFPVSHRQMLNLMERIAQSLPSGSYIGNIYGRWRDKEIIPSCWYGNNIRYQFDSIELTGFLEYDKYLRRLYGNYMNFPQKELRKAHVDNVFVK